MTADAKDRPEAARWLREPKSENSASLIEQMPRFHDWLERLGECAGDALSQSFGPGFSVAIEATKLTSTHALRAERPEDPAAVFWSGALNARLTMILDRHAVDIVVGAMFGVEATPDPAEAAARVRTELESRLVIEFVKGFATALRGAGDALADADLTFDQLLKLEELDDLYTLESPILTASFTVKTLGGALGVVLALPETLTARLIQDFQRDGVTSASRLDPYWARQMEQGVSQARLPLTAVLDEFVMTLQDISELSVGRLLPLSNDGEGKIRLDCAERGVFLCRLGERNDRYALEIEAAFPPYGDAHEVPRPVSPFGPSGAERR